MFRRNANLRNSQEKNRQSLDVEPTRQFDSNRSCLDWPKSLLYTLVVHDRLNADLAGFGIRSTPRRFHNVSFSRLDGLRLPNCLGTFWEKRKSIPWITILPTDSFCFRHNFSLLWNYVSTGHPNCHLTTQLIWEHHLPSPKDNPVRL